MNMQSGWQKRKTFQYLFVAVAVAFAVVGSVAFAHAQVSILRAAYTFDEGRGTAVVDVSGNRNRGTLSNTIWTVGQLGTALVFNGSTSRVSIADSASLRSPTLRTCAGGFSMLTNSRRDGPCR